MKNLNLKKIAAAVLIFAVLLMTAACAAAVGGDLLISAWMLRLTGSRDCLRWYQKR